MASGHPKMIFIDRKCHHCNGDGCLYCNGTGTTGDVIPSHDLSLPEPTDFGIKLKKWRLLSGVTLREFCAKTGILPSRLSDIETGIVHATEEEIGKLNDVMRSL